MTLLGMMIGDHTVIILTGVLTLGSIVILQVMLKLLPANRSVSLDRLTITVG